MEIHLNRKALREIEAPKLIQGFEKWTAIKPPKITPKGWQTIAVWAR
jgi:hypothetical protein